MNGEPAQSVSKRGRLGEGRPTKRTPEVVAKIAEAVAIGLTDEEASLLAGIHPDTMTEWRKDPEFSGAIKRATAERLLMRLERIEAGQQGWQGTAWALERLYPHRFARPEVMNQIAVVNQGGNVSTERVIVLPGEEFRRPYWPSRLILMTRIYLGFLSIRASEAQYCSETKKNEKEHKKIDVAL